HGKINVRTHSGYQYWSTWIDDHTDFWTVYLIKSKSDTFDAFKQYKAYAENAVDAKIKATQDDKGGEYMSSAFTQFCMDHGIERRHTTRNRPQQNGHAERANRTIAEGVTAMLHESGLPPSFWGEAVGAFIYVRNRSATSTVKGSTPYERWTKRKPDLSRIRIWGCTAYVHVQKDRRTTMGSHMEKCVFIGYPAGYKGWKFYNPVTKQIIISERAEFDERYFLFKGPKGPPTFSLLPELPVHTEPTAVQTPDLMGDDDADCHSNLHRARVPAAVPPPADVVLPPCRTPSPVPSENPPTPPLALRREPRARRPPGEWWRIRTPDPIVAEDTSSSSSSEDELNVIDQNLEEEAGGVAIGDEPTYSQAINSSDGDKWRKAMEEEYLMHMQNRT
ncbi:MAG TPA: hypothetical protein VM782_05770, partial [Stellaceae bacterium]|nr:hypothetical protein [Stellaceae bacterium]